MFKVLLMAFLLWNGQPIQPPIAMGVPDLEFATKVECDESLQTEGFRQASTELFDPFLLGKVPPGTPVAVVGKCLPAAQAEAMMPKDDSINE